MRFGLISVMLVLFFLFSCRNTLEDFDPGFEGSAYFPLEVGYNWIYQVDSIIYDNNGKVVDTVSVRISEDISDSFQDESGNEVYTIDRAQYEEEEGRWNVIDVWSATKDDKAAYRTEENLRFTKLNFPVKEGKSWDGNAFIDEDVIIRVAGEPIRIYQNWGNYKYASIEKDVELDGNIYEELCTVIQVDLEDQISRRYSEEKYALGIGLVHKRMIILNTQQFLSEDPWEVKAEEGFILEQRLLSFSGK